MNTTWPCEIGHAWQLNIILLFRIASGRILYRRYASYRPCRDSDSQYKNTLTSASTSIVRASLSMQRTGFDLPHRATYLHSLPDARGECADTCKGNPKEVARCDLAPAKQTASLSGTIGRRWQRRKCQDRKGRLTLTSLLDNV